MSDGEPIFGAVPTEFVATAKTIEKTTEVQAVKNLGVEKQITQSLDDKSVDDLYKNGKIDDLLEDKNNPWAQLAAVVLISNGCFLDRRYMSDRVNSINIELVATTLGITEEDCKDVRENMNNLLNFLQEDKLEIKKIMEMKSSGEDKIFLDNYSLLLEKNNILNNEIEKVYNKFLLPIRKAVLTSETVSKEYKKKIITGIGEGTTDGETSRMLKEYYPEADIDLKKSIIQTVVSAVKWDTGFFDVVPSEELKLSDVDEDEFFAVTINSKQATRDFIEKKVAPYFFANEDPKKVARCWETWRRVNGPILKDHLVEKPSGMRILKPVINKEYFQKFIDDSADLVPVLDLLSGYGFRYDPFILGEKNNVLEYSSGYNEGLKKLGENGISQLKAELEMVKSLVPRSNGPFYEYDNARNELVFRDHFSSTLRIAASQEGFKACKQVFDSLLDKVTERWRPAFITSYMESMSQIASQTGVKEALDEVSRYVFSKEVVLEGVDRFASDLFIAGLRPESGNAPLIYDFCQRYADKVRLSTEKLGDKGTDLVWYDFSVTMADLYRYQFREGEEDEAVKKAKLDLNYAYKGIFNISNVEIKDKAISNLIYALTDEQIGDIEIAKSFLNIVEDKDTKKDLEVEIQLEKERVDRGESTTWKKMEKVIRTSGQNEILLTSYFGCGLEELSESEKAQITAKLGSYHEYSKEKKEQLDQETKKVGGGFHVTINMTWQNVLDVLNSGRVLSAWENQKTIEERDKMWSISSGKYSIKRDRIERMLGNRAKGGSRDPHPIYGAAASENGRDELYGGAGGSYGECFLILKTESIKNKTSFCYDDSFYFFGNWLLDWNGGIVAKALHNLNNGYSKEGESKHGYVEAQILGGVSVDDIESINIPSSAIQADIQNNFLVEVEDLQQKYPGIKINIIKT